jgi:pantetheine-phosphate adenylyltransferase
VQERKSENIRQALRRPELLFAAVHRAASLPATPGSAPPARELRAGNFADKPLVSWVTLLPSTPAMKTSVAIYPGSFDPVTNGHLDLIERGEKMFDRLIVAVLRNAEKQPLFSVPERVEMLREVTKQWNSVEVEIFDGLLVDFARKRSAGVILRGIRAVSDYEYELQMALMNRKLEPRLETVFMIPGEPYSYLSAKLVREIAQFGAPLKGLVPPVVEERLRAKMS